MSILKDSELTYKVYLIKCGTIIQNMYLKLKKELCNGNVILP